MKIFGSDGFRSKYGTKYMTKEFITNFSRSFAIFCHRNEDSQSVIIGRDTRKSGKELESVISSVLSNNGVSVTLAGVISTPGLAFLAKSEKFSFGIMITASHNPASDNGIKIFSQDGFKLDTYSESLIEDEINNPSQKSLNLESSNIYTSNHILNKYADFFRDKFQYSNSKYRYLIDCSNGSNSEICKLLFKDNENITLIYNDPNGHNINLNCGALEPDNLYKKTVENNCDYGISFDGDGDRAIFCHHEYGIIDTEKIIALLSKSISKESLDKKTIVSTIISNKGLKTNLNELGINLIETELGDRLVVNKTIETNSLMGAETSGHYFFPDQSTTMDGLLTFFKFKEIIETSNDSIINYISKLVHYNVIKANVPVKEGLNLKVLKNRLKKEILPNEKLVLRESMWDPVIRVYYNYEVKDRFEALEKIINE